MSKRIVFQDKTRLAVVRAFFSKKNLLAEQLSFEDGTVIVQDESLARLIERFNRQKMTALPFQSPGELAWIGVSGETANLDDLASLVRTFVIPSFGHGLGNERTSELDWLPFDRAQQVLGRKYLRWTSEPDDWRQTTRLLTVGLELWDQKPRLIREETPPRFALLGRFRESLLARDWERAKALLEEISAGRLISPWNLGFLEIQLDEARGHWNGILEMESLEYLVKVTPPKRVRLAVVKAFYFERHEHLEREEQFRQSLEAFQEKQTLLWDLLRSVQPGTSWVTDRMLAYASVARRESALLDEVLERADAADMATLEEIRRLSLAPEAVKESPAEACRRYSAQGRYAEAFGVARELKYPESQKLMINITLLAGEPQLIQQLQEAFRKLHPKQREGLRQDPALERKLAALDIEEEEEKQKPPASWPEWLDRLLAEPENSASLRQPAADLAETWNPLDLPATKIKEFCDQLLEAALSEDRQVSEAFKDCYPHLATSFFTDDEFPRPPLLDIYRCLFQIATEVLTCSPHRALHTLHIAEGILQLDPDFLVNLEKNYLEWIRSGHLTEEYAETLFEIIEVMAFLGIEPSRLANLWIRAAGFLYQLPRADYSPAQVELWKNLGQFCGIDSEGLDEYFPRPEDADVEEDKLEYKLSGKLIAIFTLMPASAQRVKTVLENRYPGLDVRINSDRGGTAQLREYGKNADLLVVVAQAMKHSAFYALKSVAEASKIIYPEGRGSSALLRKIEQWES